VSPFRKILTLSAGDFLAKGLYFLAFIYLAHKLGVASYGALEFAISLRTYLLMLADGGLEMWSIREASKSTDIRGLVARLVPFRLMLAVAGFSLLMGLLWIIPDNPNLHRILPAFGLTVIAQSVSLKWAFMGQQLMSKVAVGLMCSQFVFAMGVFALVRTPEDIVWVPLSWLVGELVIVGYFWRSFIRSHGRPVFSVHPRGIISALRPAFTMGAAHAVSLINYTFDSVLIGIMLGPGSLGWYAAAYKPVTAALTIPASYFMGLFPTLSRSYAENRSRFHSLIGRSLRLTALVSLPFGVTASILAAPLIDFLFGPNYLPGVPALQLLAWSVVLVTLRGNFRQGLIAAGKQRLDLLCAVIAVSANIVFNLILVPLYGIAGAAVATLCSELLWLFLSAILFSKYVGPLTSLTALLRPCGAAAFMGICMVVSEPLYWMVRGALGGLVYIAILGLLREPELMARLPLRKPPAVPAAPTSATP